MHEVKLTTYRGKSKKKKLPKLRMPTIIGLTLHIGITDRTWENWRNSGPHHREDLAPVIARVEAIIKSQKLEGAAAELFNAGLVMRDLGMSDKTTLQGPDEGPVVVEAKSDIETARRVAWLLAQGLNIGEEVDGSSG